MSDESGFYKLGPKNEGDPASLNWTTPATTDDLIAALSDRGFLVIPRSEDGSWPDWVLTGLGWELDDSHNLSTVMDGVWRERPRDLRVSA